MVLRTLKWLVTPQRRPLSALWEDAQPKATDAEDHLGLEAIDMAHVAGVERRNQSLDRTNDIMSERRNRGSFMAMATNSAPTKFKDDADYARHYHETFQRSKDTDQ